MLSVGFWEALGQKEGDGTLKIVIVSLFIFYFLSSGLCNIFNIVSRVQLDQRRTS